ncbi:MAG: MBL fold metallo-hydrolase [bacterium]|nr:MBL fold metallo-hydrolase [bacterium]
MILTRREFIKLTSCSILASNGQLLENIVPQENGIKVIILGVAQDGGVPQLGCDCERCTAARNDHAKRRYAASIGIVTPSGYTYLIDVTPDIRGQLALLNNGVSRTVKDPKIPVDGIFLTHAHMGHYTGLMHFGYESISSKDIPVHCTGMMKKYLEDNAPWDQLISKKNIKIGQFAKGDIIRLQDGCTIEPVWVPHRQEYTDTVGFIIRGSSKSLLYIPDIDSWEQWGSETERIISESDIAIVDGSFYSGEELKIRDMSTVPHPPISISIERFRGNVDLKGTKIYFTHFNHTNPVLNEDDSIRKKITDSGFYYAERGLTFEL